MTSTVSGSLQVGLVFAGLVDILENMFSTAYGLIVMGMILLAVVFAAMTWVRTRSMVPTLGALLLGGLIVVAVANFEWLTRNIGDDVENLEDSPVRSERLSRPDRFEDD